MTTEIALGKDSGSTYEAVKGMMAVVIETSGDEGLRRIPKRGRSGKEAEMWRSGLFLNWEEPQKKAGEHGTLVAFPHPEALFYCVIACHCLWLSRVMINDQFIRTLSLVSCSGQKRLPVAQFMR